MARPHLFTAAIITLALIGAPVLPASADVEVDDLIFAGPYLLLSGYEPTSCVDVLWQTPTVVTEASLEWGYSSDDLHAENNVFPEHQNIKNLGDLSGAEDIVIWHGSICGAGPGLRIFYKVTVSWWDGVAQEVQEVSRDFTLPLAAGARHLTFFAYGDTRDVGDDYHDVSSAILNSLESAPADTKTFLLHSGDVIFNGGQSTVFYSGNHWLPFFARYPGSDNQATQRVLASVPVMVAMGNHDFHWDNHGDYPNNFFMDFPYHQYSESVGFVPYLDDDGNLQGTIDDAYYSFDYGPVHVAVLNAYPVPDMSSLGGCQIGDALKVGGTQYEWLARDLAASTKAWKVLLIHVAPLSCDCAVTDQARQDLEALAGSSGVELIVAGHDHYYTRKEYDGITHLVLGGGGAALDDTSTGCKQAVFHFARFDVVDDSELQVHVFEVHDGGTYDLLDAVTISHDGDVPPATQAGFEVSEDEVRSGRPVRFMCTTAGSHTTHHWDFGDGTTSSEPNPVHVYPPATFPVVYTATLEAGSGEPAPSASRDVTVYEPGAVFIETYGITYGAFLTRHGETLDECRDFQGSFDEPTPLWDLVPGEYTLTLRAAGCAQWQGDVTVQPGEEVRVTPEYTQVDFSDTVFVDSIPRGAAVDVTLELSSVSGTTPLAARLCCPRGESVCSYGYRAEEAGVVVEGSQDMYTGDSIFSQCAQHELKGAFVNLCQQSTSAGVPASNPLILRQPSDQRAVAGGEAMLRVSARSSLPLSFRWYEGESGDTSHPVLGATGALFVAPLGAAGSRGRSVSTPSRYWVRVHAGQSHRDSRTATVAHAGPGPLLRPSQGRGKAPATVRPGEAFTLFGSGFDESSPGENRVYFDEHEAPVQAVGQQRLDVVVPPEVAGRQTVVVRVQVGGVWGRPLTLPVED